MITDTAPYRNPFYHTPEDTPDKLDYDAMTRVVAGLEKVVDHLANALMRDATDGSNASTLPPRSIEGRATWFPPPLAGEGQGGGKYDDSCE